MEKTLVLDWVQLHVELPGANETEIISADFDGHKIEWECEQSRPGTRINYSAIIESKILHVVDDKTQTQMFREKFTIWNTRLNEEVAVLVAYPRNKLKGFNENEGILKINNKYLYQGDFDIWLANLLQELQLKFINYVRLDLAVDFLTFDEMPVIDFIEKFSQREFLKTNKAKFACYGECWNVNHGKLTGGFETVKFGMETSEVQYRLYNKSKEMACKTYKPYIVDAWKLNGYDGKQTVWRLEFVVNNNSNGFTTDQGEFISFKDFSAIKKIAELFTMLFNAHFNFVRKETTRSGSIRKQSRSTKVLLFNDIADLRRVTNKLGVQKDHSRSSKVFARHLMKLNQELRGQDFDLCIHGNELMTWIIKTRALESWAQNKFPGYQLNENILHKLQKGRNSCLSADLGTITLVA